MSLQNPALTPFPNYFSIHQLKATAQTIPQRLVHLPSSSSRAVHVSPRQHSALEGPLTLLSLDFKLGTLWSHRAAVFLKEPRVFLRLRAQECIHPSILGALPSPLWEGSSEGLEAKYCSHCSGPAEGRQCRPHSSSSPRSRRLGEQKLFLGTQH